MNIKPLMLALSLLPLSALACEISQVMRHDYIGCLSDGLALVEQEGKRDVIDKTGNLVIPIQYDYAGDFENGKAKASLNDEFFYMDKTGKRID
ncbi:MAG: WG repeat-containing protein [Moraxella sp.]|nr:WG repeat-containing protein [Moraxella sp.]